MEGGLWHLMYSHASEEGSHCLHALLCNFSLNRLSSQKDQLLNPCVYLFHWDERGRIYLLSDYYLFSANSAATRNLYHVI